MFSNYFKFFCNFSIFFTLFSNPSEACTRILYTGDDHLVMTGRSMDWSEDILSNMWVFPQGIKRDSGSNQNSFEWTSKYGSVILTVYDVGTTDGLNEKGLVANALYLVESDYGTPNNKKPIMSISLWAQYVLDNFATVSEAVDHLRKETFQVQAPDLPNGSPAHAHLSVSDASGDSAIFEYLNGRLVIHHDKEYTVMTNSPSYDQQLSLNAYWNNIGGLNFLPGTNRAADRFARASFLLNAIPKKIDKNYITAVPEKSYLFQAASSVLSVMRSVSVPLGISTPDQPNIASTLWRTVSDQKNGIYFFDSATSPNAFWVKLSELDLKKGAPIKKLVLTGAKMYSGNASQEFIPSEPFKFLPVESLKNEEKK